ncbi:hypothetical protein VCHA53O466_40012 [Vibrio chagasii]|nr:hypothetical protein VCHA53O466_40012 [Vibrio chagasii]
MYIQIKMYIKEYFPNVDNEVTSEAQRNAIEVLFYFFSGDPQPHYRFKPVRLFPHLQAKFPNVEIQYDMFLKACTYLEKKGLLNRAVFLNEANKDTQVKVELSSEQLELLRKGATFMYEFKGSTVVSYESLSEQFELTDKWEFIESNVIFTKGEMYESLLELSTDELIHQAENLAKQKAIIRIKSKLN